MVHGIFSDQQQDYADCLPDSNNFEAGFNGMNYFPYDLKKIRSKVMLSPRMIFLY